MVFPKLNAKASNTLKINDFSGGINLRDGLTEILDNQSTDVTNMYWKDGIMKTRPASDFKYEIPHDGYIPPIGMKNTCDIKTENAITVISNIKYQMVSRHDCYYEGASPSQMKSVQSHITFAWVNGTEYKTLPSITSETETAFTNYFVVQHKKDIFCFCKTSNGSGVVYRLADDDSVWSMIPEEDFYAPIVVTDARPQRHFIPKIEEIYADGGVAFEGYNLLCSRYRMIYSMINKDLDTSEEAFAMGYALSFPLTEKLNGQKVYVKFTDTNGIEHNHSVTVDVNDQLPYMIEQEDAGDDLYLAVFRTGSLLFLNGPNWEGSVALINVEKYNIRNNMEINAPYELTDEETQKVFDMTQSEWFGGDALGISGGTRLFLCGNKNDDEKSLVLWSGLDNPLYFPENCYAYVGNSNQAVTGFGRQNDTLVIFKERETYYTQYMQNTNITAEDLINQNVVDYAASSVYFPIVQLHPNIGCDLPETIQLCRNRLVWASTTGKVYTLMSQNQYSERNIYEISGMIENKLIKESLFNSCACDWNGYYLLFAGNSVYAMDYNSYGYVYASSYNRTEDANVKIPWWCWTLNNNVSSAFTVDNDVVLCTLNGTGIPESISQYFYLLDEEKTRDSGKDGELPAQATVAIIATVINRTEV